MMHDCNCIRITTTWNYVGITNYLFLISKINSDLLKTVDDEGRKSSTTNTFSFVFEVRRLHK